MERKLNVPLAAVLFGFGVLDLAFGFSKSPVTRLRRLTPGQQQRIGLLKQVARLLDSALSVPGTSMRFGLDPILGLLPGLGDLVSPLFTLGILWQARDLGIPRVVVLRMIINVAIDTLIGIVPIVGDLFDFAWKSNNMNMALLEAHAEEERRPSPADWTFVIASIAVVVVIAAIPFLLLGWILNMTAGVFR
jgi:hypothetical protein